MKILNRLWIFWVSVFAFVWIIAIWFFSFNKDVNNKIRESIFFTYDWFFDNSWSMKSLNNSEKIIINNDTKEININNSWFVLFKFDDEIFWRYGIEYNLKISVNSGTLIPLTFYNFNNTKKRNLFVPQIDLEVITDNFYYISNELNLETQKKIGDQMAVDCMYITKWSVWIPWNDNCMTIIIPNFYNDWDTYLQLRWFWNFFVEKELFYE